MHEAYGEFVGHLPTDIRNAVDALYNPIQLDPGQPTLAGEYFSRLLSDRVESIRKLHVANSIDQGKFLELLRSCSDRDTIIRMYLDAFTHLIVGPAECALYIPDVPDKNTWKLLGSRSIPKNRFNDPDSINPKLIVQDIELAVLKKVTAFRMPQVYKKLDDLLGVLNISNYKLPDDPEADTDRHIDTEDFAALVAPIHYGDCLLAFVICIKNDKDTIIYAGFSGETLNKVISISDSLAKALNHQSKIAKL